jgi:hypothetical protein
VLAGYSVERNHRAIRNDLFVSVDQAQRFAEEFAGYPIQWLERGCVPEGFPYFKGGHPRLVSYWDRTPSFDKGTGQKEGDDADLAGPRKEVGDAAAWDYYYVDPVMTNVLEPIPNAEYIDHDQHGGFYVEKVRDDHWQICRETESMYGPFVDWAPSRTTAFAKAWHLREAELAQQAKAVRKSLRAPGFGRLLVRRLLKLRRP